MRWIHCPYCRGAAAHVVIKLLAQLRAIIRVRWVGHCRCTIAPL